MANVEGFDWFWMQDWKPDPDYAGYPDEQFILIPDGPQYKYYINHTPPNDQVIYGDSFFWHDEFKASCPCYVGKDFVNSTLIFLPACPDEDNCFIHNEDE